VSTTVFAGVDEAGLGPILGPLTLGFSAFRAPAEGANLWKALAPVVTRNVKRDKSAFVVADSKEVFTRNERGAKRLETTALGFLTLLDPERRPPTSAADLLWNTPASLAPGRAAAEHIPWYRELPELPRHVDHGLLELAKEVELLGAGVAVLPAEQLNRSFHETENKAETHWQASKGVLRHLWEQYAAEGLRLTVDRHGGRFHYGPLLGRAFPDAVVELVSEKPSHAEYHVTERGGGARRMRITFAEKADRRSFAVALASCLAKYARETSMLAFNRYFASLQPDLKPTAGYRTDGWRWLEDAKPALERAGVDRAVLVRER
jgi:hypothetical protein